MNLKRWGALGTAAVSLAGAMVVTGGATAAHAITGCTWGTIWINGPAGAELPTTARGHSHKTGNHYVKYTNYNPDSRKYVWQWYADNSGGNDGDTKDTFYGYSACSNTPW
ncbi:hypothetical protein AB0J63_48910 [Streptosporangium canum]|uniref:hypothetical protein n=1 Tax=Streptosporangium canum TaxID=324952 RepID=UPI003411FDDA